MNKLNLGSASDNKEGYVNVDINEYSPSDVKHDLNKFPYPFDDNTFDEILCSHILEHLDDFRNVMKELHRISRPNGIIRIYCPYFSGITYWGEAEHKTHFSWRTFNYWCSLPMKMFELKRRRIVFSTHSKFLNRFFSPGINKFPDFYERFMCWILPSEVIEYELEVVK